MRIFSLLLMLAVLFACSPYKKIDRKNLYVDEYYDNDTVVMKNFILCSALRSGTRRSVYIERLLPYETNTILSVIEDEFYNHGLVLKSMQGENRCDTILGMNRTFRINEPIQQLLVEISDSNFSGKQLVPYIIFDEIFGIRPGILNNLIFPGGLTYRTIGVAIVIIENNEIVYIKTDQHFGKNHDVYDKEEHIPILDFQILQNLIASTLEDYIHRVKH
jgi:hypothetical protein